MACYPLGAPMPKAIVIEADPFDASMALAEAVEQQLGARVFFDTQADCIVVPAPHKVYLGGRTLRGEEYAGYAWAIESAAAGLPAKTIRHQVEQICPLDFDAFDRPCWAKLDAIYPSLPGWLGASGLPRWFGDNEDIGPCLWASVEPPGLHIGGILELVRFEDWLAALHAETADLPMRKH